MPLKALSKHSLDHFLLQFLDGPRLFSSELLLVVGDGESCRARHDTCPLPTQLLPQLLDLRLHGLEAERLRISVHNGLVADVFSLEGENG